MKNIEVEIRSFLARDQYDNLLAFFNREAECIDQDEQETYYFDAPKDLRIQRNSTGTKLWLKEGRLHDETREEVEIHCGRDAFIQFERLFLSLGYVVKIKWYRLRHTFLWQGISVMLDNTKGYGFILELEQMCDTAQKEESLRNLKEKMAALHIPLTPKEEFDRKFLDYQENWQKYINTDS